MAAMNTSASKKPVKNLIERLRSDYPDVSFRRGSQDHWSPKNNTITYNSTEPTDKMSYGVLHELAHAQLGHTTYQSDFELLKMEALAWELAAKLGKKYGVKIDNEHIENCLDTYRDWLYARSTCPKCGVHTAQKDSGHYECFNCRTSWSVSHDRFVRPYRLSKSK